MLQSHAQDQSRTLRSPQDLARTRLVAPDAVPALEAVAARYATAITPAMAALITPGDPADPIGLQYIPDEAELIIAPHELEDPTADAPFTPVKGVVHRYPDRALLKPLLACPVYCRFCFRREMVGPGGEALDGGELEAAFAYIRARPEIREAILSGGDPLVLSPRRLAGILGALDAIEHLQVLRIHSRVPLVDPARVTPALVEALSTRKALFVVLHANHPREFTDAGRAACARIVGAGIPMLSQSVLLRGVNDDAATLEALMRAFLAARIKPYYLHQLDPAPGTSHFRVPLAEGQALMRALRGRVSGLAQPTYVVDIPGGHGKVPVGPSWLEEEGLRDPSGGLHPPPG